MINYTYEQMFKNNPNSQDKIDQESILNYIRPFDQRDQFCLTEVGMPEDCCFESYIFYRAFHNPNLKAFSISNLH